MTVPLEAHQQHDDEQVTDVQTRRRRVETDVAAHRTTVQNVADLIGVLIEQATPFQVVEQRMRSHGTKIDRKGMNILWHSH